MTTTKRSVLTFLSAITLGATLLSASAFAADKTYQVTGPILEVTDATITVQKGKETWQIARDKDTKVTGDLKIGAKVTIMYRMTAATIEAKGGEAKGSEAKGSEAKGSAAKAAPAKK